MQNHIHQCDIFKQLGNWLKQHLLLITKDISDASEIWSEYGDEIVVDKQPKNLRWDPSDKKVSQRLSLREKGIKKTTTKKKK